MCVLAFYPAQSTHPSIDCIDASGFPVGRSYYTRSFAYSTGATDLEDCRVFIVRYAPLRRFVFRCRIFSTSLSLSSRECENVN